MHRRVQRQLDPRVALDSDTVTAALVSTTMSAISANSLGGRLNSEMQNELKTLIYLNRQLPYLISSSRRSLEDVLVSQQGSVIHLIKQHPQFRSPFLNFRLRVVEGVLRSAFHLCRGSFAYGVLNAPNMLKDLVFVFRFLFFSPIRSPCFAEIVLE